MTRVFGRKAMRAVIHCAPAATIWRARLAALQRIGVLLPLAFTLGGCAGAGWEGALSGLIEDAPVESAGPVAAQGGDPQRLWEAAAASDAMRVIAAEFSAAAQAAGGRPILAIDPRGGTASATLADAAARGGFETAVDCAGAQACLPASLSVAPLGERGLLARLDLRGALQASWAYRIERQGLAPATGFTIGRVVAEVPR